MRVKKRNRGKILTEEGHLRRIAMQADSNSVSIGSPLIYGGTHQFGAEQGAFGVTSRGSPIPWGDIPLARSSSMSRGDLPRMTSAPSSTPSSTTSRTR